MTVEKAAKEAARQMGLAKEEAHKRGRQNDRSLLRKIVASISHRTLGIPVTEIARYYGVDSSTVSRMPDYGEASMRKLKIKVV